MSSPYQELAESLARISVKEMGFVVVHYRVGEQPSIGKRERELWAVFPMPQTFVVTRKATKAETRAQFRLFREVTGLRPHTNAKKGTPWVLVAAKKKCRSI